MLSVLHFHYDIPTEGYKFPAISIELLLKVDIDDDKMVYLDWTLMTRPWKKVQRNAVLSLKQLCAGDLSFKCFLLIQ